MGAAIPPCAPAGSGLTVTGPDRNKTPVIARRVSVSDSALPAARLPARKRLWHWTICDHYVTVG